MHLSQMPAQARLGDLSVRTRGATGTRACLSCSHVGPLLVPAPTTPTHAWALERCLGETEHGREVATLRHHNHASPPRPARSFLGRPRRDVCGGGCDSPWRHCIALEETDVFACILGVVAHYTPRARRGSVRLPLARFWTMYDHNRPTADTGNTTYSIRTDDQPDNTE
uniref:Uncharacterized protein n=1 Tax=Mycena chlorophos TaxID=658473 RepID=A0ABQ0L770_MYCCL|nr:predicted protein [Mycena chlorophos]